MLFLALPTVVTPPYLDGTTPKRLLKHRLQVRRALPLEKNWVVTARLVILWKQDVTLLPAVGWVPFPLSWIKGSALRCIRDDGAHLRVNLRSVSRLPSPTKREIVARVQC